MNYNIVFESETFKHIGNLWAGVSVLKVLAWLVVFAIILYVGRAVWKWATAGTASGIELKSKSFAADKLRWEHAIDDRVKMLDALKSNEVAIRDELNKLHEVKSEIDATNDAVRKKTT